MENPSAPKRAAADRSDDERISVRDDITMDGERKHQRLCEETPRCGPVSAGMGRFHSVSHRLLNNFTS